MGDDTPTPSPDGTVTPPTAAVVFAMIVGLVAGAVAGCGVGLLMLEFFAGPWCCGLEGLTAPFVGVIMGAITGALTAGLLVVDRANEGIPHPLKLVILWPSCLALAWAVGGILDFNYEDLVPIVVFHLLGLVAPLVLWRLWPRAARPLKPNAG